MSLDTLAGIIAPAPDAARAPGPGRASRAGPISRGSSRPAWSGEHTPEMASFRPHPTATAAVVDHLRRLILCGRLPPGEYLHQQHLASRLGVSRMPVSHAFARLEAEGLVTIMPHRFACAQVASVSAEDCVELFDIRLALESCALRRAFARHTCESLSRVRGRQQALHTAVDPQHWIVAGQQFHAALYAPGTGALTAQKIQWFQQFLERYVLAFADAASIDFTGSALRTAALIDALEAGDEAGAQALLSENLSAMKTLILGVLPGQNSNFFNTQGRDQKCV